MWPRAQPVAERLAELSAGSRTGALRVAGEDGGGVIYLRDGGITFAAAARVVGPALIERLRELSPAARAMLCREATIDSVLELTRPGPRSSRFRAGEAPPAECSGPGPGPRADELMAEVARRVAVAAQLAGVVTPDTRLRRAAAISWPSVRISDAQWSLLIRVTGQMTARELALTRGMGVFATTMEAYRLLALRLLQARGEAWPEPAAGSGRGYPGQVVSFTRAAAR